VLLGSAEGSWLAAAQHQPDAWAGAGPPLAGLLFQATGLLGR
jgi:hypothetical protein